ncbi:SWIM zinc finger family protein [Myxacorys almedinensis]|uniref:SWIM zinc finger domain-containing protein n=1 Tax=Myxacorys almedinensis A TaxID=2690445 RepID=A0A8J7Z188_9CYAN|nr:SWIM zinc finger family protein [Myxacorys almedinensis]NDJ17305.1 SWIM zinc finger domain-containing protein [Myxacorys almedinensis A]
MQFPSISEGVIRHNSTENSLSRGKEYDRMGSVVDVVQRGAILQAEVEGTEVKPYRVTLEFDAGGITDARCTCPYEYGGWCKHIVATVLTCDRQPDKIEARPTLVQLLDRLNPVQTQRLVQELVAEQPELIELVDRQVHLMTNSKPATAARKPRQSPIDVTPFRRQVRHILREGIRELEYGCEHDPFGEALSELIDRARSFSQNEDGESARCSADTARVAILEAITQGYAEEWDELNEYGGEIYGINQELNEAWSEAILSTDIDEAQAVDLQAMLEAWQDELQADFSMSLAALEQGWNDPTLLEILAGTLSEAEFWIEERPDFTTDLALIRLQILDRQDRDAEYLNLARVAGLTEQYLTRLAESGDVETAIALAETELSTVQEAFALATTLRESNHLAEALEVAKLGLAFSGYELYNFAIWTGELAEGLNQDATAIEAYETAFSSQPSFDLYQRLQTLAGKNWKRLQPKLLQALRRADSWNSEAAKVDIFLHEELWDDAISTVNKRYIYNVGLAYRVMDAVIAHQPDWVIETAIQNADEIMNAGKSEKYNTAIEWLKRAKAAYVESDRQSEWQTYRRDLVLAHGKKRKLMALLDTAKL